MIVNELFTTEQVATNTPRHHSHAPMQSYVLDLELMTTEFLEPLLALPAISCVRVAPDDATNVGAPIRRQHIGDAASVRLAARAAAQDALRRARRGEHRHDCARVALRSGGAQAMRKWPVTNIARPLSVRARRRLVAIVSVRRA